MKKKEEKREEGEEQSCLFLTSGERQDQSWLKKKMDKGEILVHFEGTKHTRALHPSVRSHVSQQRPSEPVNPARPLVFMFSRFSETSEGETGNDHGHGTACEFIVTSPKAKARGGS